MTTVKIKKQNYDIIGVECSDHTGFAESGKDIVCAWISCITQTAVLGVQELTNVKNKLKIDEKKAYLKFELIDIEHTQSFHDAQIIFQTMLKALENMQKQYPKYIKLEVN